MVFVKFFRCNDSVWVVIKTEINDQSIATGIPLNCQECVLVFLYPFYRPFFAISPSRIPLICGYVSNLESFMSAFVFGFGTGHMFALFSFIPANILVVCTFALLSQNSF